MVLRFYKFQANGNDFILIDDRESSFPVSRENIARLCHRRFGIGADGLMLLGSSDDYDFVMQYFNSDGSLGEMCGNGGRSMAALAYMKGIVGKEMRFVAGDGVHEARVKGEDAARRIFDVSLKMLDVQRVQLLNDGLFLNTGVPHFVQFVSDIEAVDVKKSGRALRNDVRFTPEGTNVDFVEIQKNRLFVRTYERGVEDETLSCGTGVTASAIAFFLKTGLKIPDIHTHGGNFQVHFQETDSRFENISLHGPAELVFEGTVLV
jgi:diaminopimelate epimerase